MYNLMFEWKLTIPHFSVADACWVDPGQSRSCLKGERGSDSQSLGWATGLEGRACCRERGALLQHREGWETPGRRTGKTDIWPVTHYCWSSPFYRRSKHMNIRWKGHVGDLTQISSGFYSCMNLCWQLIIMNRLTITKGLRQTVIKHFLIPNSKTKKYLWWFDMTSIPNLKISSARLV